jgi:uncharacterized protein
MTGLGYNGPFMDSDLQAYLYSNILQRTGELHVNRRMSIQVAHVRRVYNRRYHRLYIENLASLMRMLRYGLTFSRLRQRGLQNCLDIQVVERTVQFPGLPAAFNGYRILHLSDTHLDLHPALTPAILDCLAPLEYDLAVVSGDYRASTYGPYQAAMQETEKVIRALKSPALGILGNHDFLEFVPFLESYGLKMLLNETVRLERDGKVIYISGVDDPHFYEVDDLQRARNNIPLESFSILLAHSPEIYREAAASGFNFMLCGHTHAGQICLPGRIPLVINADCPRSKAARAWEHAGMQGYTSPGTGTSGVPARFFCPPEITIHVLSNSN